jgi:hypothetical protein
MSKEKLTTVIKEDENGELYIEFPEGFIQELGWDENTDLIMEVNKNKEIILREVNSKDAFIVSENKSK